MIYTDPVQGAKSGYNYDGWDADDTNVFYCTGEGAVSDQEMRDGNRAILEHEETGRTLRLFEAASSKKQPGGKPQRYRCAFWLDSRRAYRTEPAPDRDGNPRKVIVFRLIREGAVALDQPLAQPSSCRTQGLADGTRKGRRASGRVGGRRAGTSGPWGPRVELVSTENNEVEELDVAPRAGAKAERDEAKLVRSFEAQLRNQGNEVASPYQHPRSRVLAGHRHL